jgi:1-deoxy-D-xylulose-5-phosphate reductoisomerase
MVEYSDGSVIAQLSTTDMRMPIQYAMTWPERWDAPVARMDWRQVRQLDFYPPDFGKFPLLRLAYQAQRTGGSATCTLNAADEVAVAAFLNEQILYPAIAEVVEDTLNRVPVREPASIGEVLEIDRESREVAREVVKRAVAHLGQRPSAHVSQRAGEHVRMKLAGPTADPQGIAGAGSGS